MSIKPFDHVLASLHHINDNFLAISSLGQLIHGLMDDAESMDQEDEKRFEALEKFGKGYFNYGLARAIEILADDGREEWDRVFDAYKKQKRQA